MYVIGQRVFLGYSPSRGKLGENISSLYWFCGHFGSSHWKQRDQVEECDYFRYRSGSVLQNFHPELVTWFPLVAREPME